jgi:hypothetical protein
VLTSISIMHAIKHAFFNSQYLNVGDACESNIIIPLFYPIWQKSLQTMKELNDMNMQDVIATCYIYNTVIDP